MYRVQWKTSYTEHWLTSSDHFFLFRARRAACRKLSDIDSVDSWRVIDDDGNVLYRYLKVSYK